ncbi:uncharacterized protein LY89DRAFT_303726 [Mollisia scopiformis]|uniref:Yeast cell wall synthesis Kre9/Knh1-like N-terminal domain-containing protein n=1 Tax=Mollisia scopiformis TaxID=149040 RepID=A0A194XQX7_MOLSC|nr:uncharacterized protein LY89DRAFT_303726 [Mollisia scopiformis]KUJ22556.1 hypothetical protein LY89DRAFT_303726 [Mollisia scopiformis]
MRFSTVSAVLAFAASTYAQTAGFDPITAPTQDQDVAAGSTLDIIWEPSANYTGTISITLLEGATPATLSLGDVVKAGIENSVGKYSWAIPSDIASFATYGFKLTLDSDTTIFQYSFPFHITGASSTSSGSVTAVSTKTMILSTGTAYTPSSTPTSSANITSVVKTASSNATTMSTATSVKPTGNSTLTYITPTTTGAGSTASKTGSATTTSSGPASATTNAAVANIASGSMALFGGLILAFAL